MMYPGRQFLFTMLTIVASALLILAAQPANAATTYYINPGEMIQDAINGSINGDTIIVRAGTYIGDGNRNLDFSNGLPAGQTRAITLKSESGADVTIIDCEGTEANPYRGFDFHSGEGADSIIDGFTITNGYTSYPDNGGAIRCDCSSPTIVNCTISSNTSGLTGGGISCGNDSSPTITNCTITGNTAKSGGGVRCDCSSPTISNCIISGNAAIVRGGGISCDRSSPVISNSIVSGNQCENSGGIYCHNGSPTITNCVINDNSGPGISCSYYSSPSITNCSINGNMAESGSGAGIRCNSNCNPTITNSTICNNKASTYGGGIYCRISSPKVTNCTISGNSAPSGGGIFCWLSSNPVLTNCILWGNTAPDGHEISLASTTLPSTLTVRYSDVQGGAGESYVESGATLDLDGTNIDGDPVFVSVTEGNYRLAAGSPCIDAGTSDGATAADMDGTLRWDDIATPNTGGGTPDYYDIGAYEFMEYYVNGDPSEGDNSYDGLARHWDGVHGPKLTIQAGIDADAVGWTYSVLVAPWTYTGSGNRDLDFGGKAIRLRSENGANVTIIDCEDSGRGFYFHSGETDTSIVDGFTIANGYTTDYGGGIYFTSNSGPTITNCTISGNSADYYGGGISCWDSNPTITNCTISGNSAEYYGGGIYCYYSNPMIGNCTISDNTVTDWHGGGIFCYGSNPAMTDCILWGNTAPTGHEIALLSTSCPSMLTVRYSNVQGGASEAYVDPSCTLDLDGTNIDADPLFVYAEGGNFRLKHGSPCIDAGTSDGATSEDIDGIPRWDDLATPNTGGGTPDYYDIGAHEFKGYYVNGDPAEGDDSYDGLAPEWDGEHGPKRTIQAGLDADAVGWTYSVVVAPWTYTGPGNRDLDFWGKAITLESEAGADVTIIDCENSDRGFTFNDGETKASVVDGFTITNGNAGSNFGGGIKCYDGSNPTIANCTITDSTAHSGGGICCDLSRPTITNCTVNSNTAESCGGGIFCFESNPTIASCTITGNTAESYNGGGIYCFMSSSPTIADCTITGNTAESYSGGGIYCGSNSDPTITNCTINSNSATYGGGIYCDDSSPTITNCMISDNSAETYDGGGILCTGESSPLIANCTISGNSAESGNGGGILCWDNCNPTMTNCILWGNTAISGHEIDLRSTNYPSTLTVRYSDVQGGAAEAYIESGCTLDLDGTNIDADPKFVLGPFGCYYLSQTSAGQPVDSPCIDAGSDTAANLGLEGITTSNGSDPDSGMVDIGYHYPLYDGIYITWIERGASHLVIYWKGEPGNNYVVQWSADLTNWEDENSIIYPVEGANNVWSWIDACTYCFTKRYYRVREQ